MKWTMEDFKHKKIAVKPGKHMMDFLKMCEREGLMWGTIKRATDFVPDDDEDVAISFNSANISNIR